MAITLTLRMVSSPVKKRFPTYGHLVEAGLMTEDEKRAILTAQSKSEYLNYVYWMPLRQTPMIACLSIDFVYIIIHFTFMYAVCT